jgi:hypothetical protein
MEEKKHAYVRCTKIKCKERQVENGRMHDFAPHHKSKYLSLHLALHAQLAQRPESRSSRRAVLILHFPGRQALPKVRIDYFVSTLVTRTLATVILVRLYQVRLIIRKGDIIYILFKAGDVA